MAIRMFPCFQRVFDQTSPLGRWQILGDLLQRIKYEREQCPGLLGTALQVGPRRLIASPQGGIIEPSATGVPGEAGFGSQGWGSAGKAEKGPERRSRGPHRAPLLRGMGWVGAAQEFFARAPLLFVPPSQNHTC